MMTMVMTTALAGCGILALAAVLSLALDRASASLRHLVWSAALGALLVLPALEASGVRIEIPVPAVWLAATTRVAPPATERATPAPTTAASAPSGETSATSATAETSETAESDARSPARLLDDEVGGAPAAAARSASERASRAPTAPDRLVPLPSAATEPKLATRTPSEYLGAIAVVIWALGTLLLLGNSLTAHRSAHRLTRRGISAPTDFALMRLRLLAAKSGITRPVRLVVSDHLRVPATWGLTSATIVLPTEYEAWSVATLDRVLLHELAHVARRDCQAHLLGEVVRAIHWPNPLTWLAVARQRVESERACDDHVLRQGDRASAYAQDLVGIARTLRPGARLSGATLAIARTSQVSARVRDILATDRRRGATGPGTIFGVGVGALLASMALTLVAPVATAQPAGEPVPEPSPRVVTTPAAESQPERRLVVPDEQPTELTPPPASLDARLFETPEPIPVERRSGGARSSVAVPTIARSIGARVSSALNGQAGPNLQEMCVFRDDVLRSSRYSVDDDVMHIRWETDSCRVEIEMEGEVDFAADDSGIVSMGDGALFEIEERVGRSSRRVRLGGERGGAIERRYWVDGETTAWGADAEAWLANILPELFRHTTINAEARVRRFVDAGGPDAVFSEIALMRSDHVRRVYAELLMESAELATEEYRRVIDIAADIESDHNASELIQSVIDRAGLRPGFEDRILRAAAGIDSDHQKATVLQALLATDLSPAQLEAVLEASRSIESDHQLGEILSTVARRGILTDAGRSTFIETLESIESDHQHAMVLGAFLDQGRLSAEELSAVLDMTHGIESDHQRATVLQRVAEEYPLTGDEVTAYLRAAAGIESDHQLATTAEVILERSELSTDQLRLVLAMATEIESDHQRAMVLTTVVDRRELTGEEVDGVLAVAREIASDHQLAQVLHSVATEQSLDSPRQLSLLRVAEGIGSDHNCMTVLVALAERQSLSDDALRSYRSVAEGLGRSQRNEALAALAR